MDSYYCTLLICGYGFIAYPQQIANTYVVVKDKVKQRAYIAVAALLLNITLAFFFGKLWGAIGVSVAICVALVFNTVLMNVLYRRVLGISLKRFFKGCHLRLLPGICLYAAATLGISYLPMSGWLGFLCKVALASTCYIIVAWFLFLGKEQRKNLVRRK